MKLNIDTSKINFTNIKSTVSKSSEKGIKDSEPKVTLRAYYDSDKKIFYCTIDNEVYPVKLINTRIEYLFSSPDNDKYDVWTCRKTFKNRNSNDNNISIYWKYMFNEMPIKGTINKHNDTYILDVVYYQKQCIKRYNESSKRIEA